MSSPLRDPSGLTEAEYLAAYDADRYPRPSVTVDLVLFTATAEAADNYRKLPGKELRVLLGRRANHPFLGQWALPGGFVGLDEGLGAAAARVLRCKTGLDEAYLEQLYTWGAPDRDPRTRVISCSYLGLVEAGRLAQGPDLTGQWFTVREELLAESRVMEPEGSVEQRTLRLVLTAGAERLAATVQVTRRPGGQVERTVLDPGGLAFDHARMIHYGLARLRSKLEWTDIAFHLLPPRFTLGELQQVYEVILQRELLTANFRRKTAPLVLETNEMRRDAGHRPAKLYRFNPNGAESGL
jgi:8-oxo-dGTP diphosphatase